MDHVRKGGGATLSHAKHTYTHPARFNGQKHRVITTAESLQSKVNGVQLWRIAGFFRASLKLIWLESEYKPEANKNASYKHLFPNKQTQTELNFNRLQRGNLNLFLNKNGRKNLPFKTLQLTFLQLHSFSACAEMRCLLPPGNLRCFVFIWHRDQIRSQIRQYSAQLPSLYKPIVTRVIWNWGIWLRFHLEPWIPPPAQTTLGKICTSSISVASIPGQKIPPSPTSFCCRSSSTAFTSHEEAEAIAAPSIAASGPPVLACARLLPFRASSESELLPSCCLITSKRSNSSYCADETINLHLAWSIM